MLSFFMLLFFLFLALFSPFRPVFALSLDEELQQVSKQLADLEKAISPLKQETGNLSQKIASAKVQITKAEKQIQTLSLQLTQNQQELDKQRTYFELRVRNHYINSSQLNSLLTLLSTSRANSMLRQYSWYQALLNHNQQVITQYLTDIRKLTENQKQLALQKAKLISLRQSLESRFGFLNQEIKKAEDYKQSLSNRQKELIAQKEALFSTSVGDVSTSDDPASRADYNPGFSPAFAAFSFGAPHRKGMSQYGAYGRSKAGQNYETILKAYYGNIRIEKIDSPGSINTTVGTLPFEDNYLVGIAEMPIGWGDRGGFEAQKAQAIAARTYALNYLNYSLSNRKITGKICVTEACQVYSRTRQSNPGIWKKAVEETRGMVAVSSSTNNIFSTMYASTSGGSTYGYTSQGHTTPSTWDTTCGGLGCWPNDAYEKQGGSPWYYKGWYKSRSNQACGRSHPWLNQSEFSDILNAVLVYQNDRGAISHLSQYDTGSCGSRDPEAWSTDALRQKAANFSGPISQINSVSVQYGTGGTTQNVQISTDKGNFTFNGSDFKEIFTLRAPGAIHLKSLLFNIEKK